VDVAGLEIFWNSIGLGAVSRVGVVGLGEEVFLRFSQLQTMLATVGRPRARLVIGLCGSWSAAQARRPTAAGQRRGFFVMVRAITFNFS
jgi:hypothetical protein